MPTLSFVMVSTLSERMGALAEGILNSSQPPNGISLRYGMGRSYRFAFCVICTRLRGAANNGIPPEVERQIERLFDQVRENLRISGTKTNKFSGEPIFTAGMLQAKLPFTSLHGRGL